MPLPPLDGLGGALRNLRRLARLTQRDVAEATGLTRPMVSSYERGRTLPSLPSLWTYLDALGTDLTYLEKIMREREERKETARRHRDEVRPLIDWLLDHEP